ncbi:MAG: hypothetical protein K2H61_08475 [Muribaculaceae bacterium]|nr:hypothetical protein [Muribaculaceae bacterium]
MLKRLSILLTIALMLLPAFAKKPDATQSTRAKADYLYLEAERQKALGNPTLYMQLLERAYNLDPSQEYLGFDLGFLYMTLSNSPKGYDLMKRYVSSSVSDKVSASLFAKIAERLNRPDDALWVWQKLDSIYPADPTILFNQANNLASRRDSTNIRKALDIVDRIETTSGITYMTAYTKASLASSIGDTLASVNAIKALIAENPRDPNAFSIAGEVFQHMNKLDSAMIFYNQGIEIDPVNGQLLVARAQLNDILGDSAAFDRDIFDMLANSDLPTADKNEYIRNYVAELYQDSLQHPRINRLFALMTERNNRDAELRRLYSSYLYLIEDYNGATEQLKMLAYIEPDDPDNLVAIEQTLLMAEKPAEAVKHAQESAQQFPANDIFPTMEGYGLAQLKRYPEAIQSFTRALELVDSTDQSRRSSLITSIGDMTSSAGDTIAALNYYEKAIELDPTNLMAKNNLAYFITLSGGDLDRAEKLSYETIIAKPTSSTELDTYAWILFKQGEYKKAKDYIDRALAFLEDDSADVYEHAGDIYFFNSLPDEALKFWERAGELDPDNKLLHRKIAARTFLYK